MTTDYSNPEVLDLAEPVDRAHQGLALAMLRQAVVDAGRIKSKVGETHQARLDARSRDAVAYLVVGLWEPDDGQAFHVLTYLPHLIKHKAAITGLADDLYNRRRPAILWADSSAAIELVLSQVQGQNAPPPRENEKP